MGIQRERYFRSHSRAVRLGCSCRGRTPRRAIGCIPTNCILGASGGCHPSTLPLAPFQCLDVFLPVAIPWPPPLVGALGCSSASPRASWLSSRDRASTVQSQATFLESADVPFLRHGPCIHSRPFSMASSDLFRPSSLPFIASLIRRLVSSECAMNETAMQSVWSNSIM